MRRNTHTPFISSLGTEEMPWSQRMQQVGQVVSGVLFLTLNCNAACFSSSQSMRRTAEWGSCQRKLLINPGTEARRQCSVNRKDCDWEWRSLVVNSNTGLDSQTLSTSDIEYQDWRSPWLARTEALIRTDRALSGHQGPGGFKRGFCNVQAKLTYDI